MNRNSERPACLITGTSGYVGSRLAKHFRQNGWYVYGLGRRPGAEDTWIPYTIGQALPALPQAAVAIHAAYDFEHRIVENNDANLSSALEFLRAAALAGASRRAFISSMSAYPNAKSSYGKSKFAAEVGLLTTGTLCVRPGLVVGSDAGGVSGAIEKAVKRLKVIPVIAGDAPLYLCPIDALVRSIYSLLLEDASLEIPVVIASKEATPLRQLVKHFANVHSLQRFCVDLPARPAIRLMALAEQLGASFAFRSDSAIGLLDGNPRPDADVLWIDTPT